MSMYTGTDFSIVPELSIHAPFYGAESDVVQKLKDLGVIKRSDEVDESVVLTLAKVFAHNFFEKLLDDLSDENNVYITMQGISELADSAETIGLYYFVLLKCGMLDYDFPHELNWIACDQEVLTSYMQAFADTLENLFETNLSSSSDNEVPSGGDETEMEEM